MALAISLIAVFPFSHIGSAQEEPAPPGLLPESGSSSTTTESSEDKVEFSVGAPHPSPSPSAPAPSPTPNPWRQLTVATKTLSPASEGDIMILNSFAVAKRDGTQAAVCISFRNTATRVATRVVFGFTLVDGNGGEVGELVLDRKGTFTPGVDINGYGGLADWSNHAGNRGYADNCVSLQRQMAALPILSAQFATYAIKSVEYADGTTWANPGAPPKP